MDMHDEINERKRQVVNLIRDAIADMLIADDFETAAERLDTAALMCRNVNPKFLEKKNAT